MSQATIEDAPPRTGVRVRVQKLGTALSNMVMPNIGAFIAWGLITALFIEQGWLQGIFASLKNPDGWVAQIDFALDAVKHADERARELFVTHEISIGDYVLTGGEIAAQVLIDATVRLIPRVLGNQESLAEESFSHGLLEHPQYTKPPVWEGRAIPDILLSGNHAKIAAWRRAQAESRTRALRPDLTLPYDDAG